MSMKLSMWTDVGRMDELARLDTPAHRLDARVKTFVTLVFLAVVMSFPRREISALMPLALYPVYLVAVGRIPVLFILRKVFWAAPFALAVAIWNPLFDTVPALSAGGVVISSGWVSFASIMVRFVLTVATALTLVTCTGMPALCHGLERLGMPRVFATQLLFLYRYLFVLAEEGGRMLRGVQCRGGGALGFRTYVGLVGHLLLRAMDRADRVFRAMVARGFDGDIRPFRPLRLRLADLVFLAAWILFFAAARRWNLADALGRLVL